MPLRAVAFDLDDTLVLTDRDRQTLLDEATAAAGVPGLDRAEYLATHGADVATETRAPIFERLLDGEGDPEALARAYRDAVNDALTPLPGIPDLLAELGGQYEVGLLTDGPSRAQRSKLDRLGWAKYFDAIVVTGELGASKPDRRAFEALSDALGVPPEEIVYVGDKPEIDIEGAHRAGMVTIQVCDGDPPHSDADASVQRDSLAEDLRALLRRQQRL